MKNLNRIAKQNITIIVVGEPMNHGADHGWANFPVIENVQGRSLDTMHRM